MKSSILITLLISGICQASFSQGNSGTISGSIKSTSHFYVDDNTLSFYHPLDRFASNSYLWLQYTNGPITAGIQYEAYMPPLQGFPYQYEGNTISHKFLRFKKGIIDITAGNFYEQFGTGLSFRSYENRALGLNNSLEGLRVLLKPASGISMKAIYGKPRRYSEYADAYVRGIDGEIDIATFFKSDRSLIIGGGVLSRYNPYTGPELDFPATVNAINSRIRVDLGKVSFYSEYVHKSADPDALNQESTKKGQAFSTNATFASNGIGIFLATRLLKEMNFQAERSITDGYSNINYLPSNTRQYTYMLSNIYPYTTQPDGEFSIQADISYSVPTSSKRARKYGTDLRFNYANVRGLKSSDPDKGIFPLLATNKYFGDFNIEVTRKWSRKLKTHIAFQKIYFNRGQIEGNVDDIIESTILIFDGTARLTKKVSVRTELQHLWSEDDHGNWFAALVELNYSPNWSVHFSNMTDYRYSDQAHYYNYGISYRTNYFRISVGYGKNKEGYICSGGVCRKTPAYKGFNFGITTSF